MRTFMHGSATCDFIKTLEDRVLGAVLLVVSIPLMVVAAIAVRLSSPGPVVFRQPRHGLHGRVFCVLKLRTLHKGRPTRVGRVLRLLSIDELPQLFNVLLGQMSLVGPRPHPVELNNRYGASVAGFSFRHTVRPGITGLAQVSGARGPVRTRADMRRRLTLDSQYIRDWSPWLDFVILARTIGGAFFDRHAADAEHAAIGLVDSSAVNR